MKPFLRIFALYLLLLAVFPCCAYDECPDEKTSFVADKDHVPGDDDCGTCSPFFQCEGCATVSIAYEPAIIAIPVLKQMAVPAFYIPRKLAAVSLDFWQPPQLS